MSTQQIAEYYPGFNREVVPVVFLVDGIGFKIDAAVLTAHSQFFSDMLGSPDIGLDGEGTERRPIVVDGTTKEQFANFCRWLTHKSWSKLEATAENLIDLLHVSHLFQVDDGQKYAIHALDELSPRLSLCWRLNLSLRYGIHSWVETTVRALLYKPAYSYDEEDLAYIGISAFSLILATKERIIETRTNFANFPIEPSSQSELDHTPFCDHDRHVKCRRAWIERWFTHLARKIHSADAPIALADAPLILQTMGHPGMKQACKDYHLELVQRSAELPREERFIEEVVRQIKRLVKD